MTQEDVLAIANLAGLNISSIIPHPDGSATALHFHYHQNDLTLFYIDTHWTYVFTKGSTTRGNVTSVKQVVELMTELAT